MSWFRQRWCWKGRWASERRWAGRPLLRRRVPTVAAGGPALRSYKTLAPAQALGNGLPVGRSVPVSHTQEHRLQISRENAVTLTLWATGQVREPKRTAPLSLAPRSGLLVFHTVGV